MHDDILIRIPANQATVATVEWFEGRIKKTKQMLMESVAKLLLKAEVQDLQYTETYSFLPDRKVRTIWHYTDNRGGFAVVMVLPAGRYDMTLDNVLYKAIGIPQMLFGFKVQGSRIVNSKACVVTDVVITPKSKVFHYPFSNVDNQFGICWGANVLPDIKEPEKLASIPLYFMSIPNSQHSYGKNTTGLPYKKFLKSLEGKDFDNEILINAEGRTVEDFTRLFLQRRNLK